MFRTDRSSHPGLTLTLMLASILISISSATAFAQSERPNIVLMMTDNTGWGELGVYGGGMIRGTATPRLDALAAEGMQLLNFNVEPQCVPSRSALMTGRHPIRSGTTHVVWGMLYGLTQWEVTMAEMLSDQGYATAHFGKWHLGDIEGRMPTDQGFDEWYGIPNTTDESLNEFGIDFDPDVARAGWIYEGVAEQPSTQVRPYDLQARREIDTELTERTIAFMERNAAEDRPFFAYVPYTQPHIPALPHPEFAGSTGNGDYADVVVEMDTLAGRVLDAIDRLGIRENTIVIWTSDNGPEDIFPYHGAAGPWRGTYFTGLEASLRVPFLIRWPDRIPAGSVSNEIVHQIDLFPTIARIVGAEVPQDRIIDGVDQLDFFTGISKSSARDGFPVHNGPELFGYKWRNFKLHLVHQDRMLGMVERGVMFKVFHLLRDPKERYDLIENDVHGAAWVAPPIFERIVDFQQSFLQEPPIPMGTPEPWVPQP